MTMNRKGLVVALCALMGCATFVGCADDSGKSQEVGAIKLDPKSVKMDSGATETVEVSYLAGESVSLENNDSDCVTVAKKVKLDEDGKGEIEVYANGAGCKAEITVSASDDSVTSKKLKVEVAAANEDANRLSLSKDNLDLDAGEVASVTASYKSAKGDALSGKDLAVTSSKQTCAFAESDIKTTSDGQAEIQITAIDVTEECETLITVKGSDGGSAAVKVKVKPGDVSEPEADKPTLEFEPATLVLSPDNKDGETVVLSYYDGTAAKPLGGYPVTFTTEITSAPESGGDCFMAKPNAKKTDNSGQIEILIKPKGATCEGTYTAKQGSKAEKILNVMVTDQKEINISGVELRAENKYDKMAHVAFRFANENCEAALENYRHWAALDLDYAEAHATKDGYKPVLHSFKDSECSGCLKGVDVTTNLAVFGYALNGDATEDDLQVVGYGCTDISLANNNQTVTVDLVPTPIDISGKYLFTANFDLQTAIPNTNKDMPKVEAMTAADWVQFIIDLFDYENDKGMVKAILNFTWSNTIARLEELGNKEDANQFVKLLVSTIATLRGPAINALDPLITKYIAKKDETTGRSWLDIFKMVSPDVVDLVNNMQMSGVFEIKRDVVSLDGKLIGNGDKGATEIFDQVEYQWSYIANGETVPKGCLNTAYGNEKKCRVQMELGANSISGTWTGEIKAATNTSVSEDALQINSHPLNFKWATILYTAVFGHILPKALNYFDSSQARQNGKYITAFLENVAFKPIIASYVSEKAGQPKEDDPETKYPELTITNEKKICERFIETLVYLVYPNDLNGLVKFGLDMGADLACGDQGLGQLDKLIETQLGKFEENTANAIQLKTIMDSDCPLFDEGGTQYQKMGQKDQGTIPSAHEIYGSLFQKEDFITKRCKWEISLPASVSENPIKGAFHAERVGNAND